MIRILILILTIFSWMTPVYAYIGPGAGLGAIGTAIALLVALLLLIVGFVWYPLKRILRRRKSAKAQSEADKS